MSAEMPSSKNVHLWQANYKSAKTLETIIRILCGFFAVISIATTAGIIGTLIFETLEFFQEVPLWQFLTDTRWTPLFASKQFGIFVLMSATLLTSTIAVGRGAGWDSFRSVWLLCVVDGDALSARNL